MNSIKKFFINKIIYTVSLCLISFVGASTTLDCYSATKTTNAKSSSKNKSPKKKSSNNTSKKTSSKGRKKSSKRKGSSKSKSAAKAVEKPQEVVMNDDLTIMVNQNVLDWIPSSMNPGGLRVNSVIPDSTTKTTKIGLNENFTYLPVTNDMVKNLREHIESILPDSLSEYKVNLFVGDKTYAYFITTIDKLPESARKNIPFVISTEPYVNAKKGMEGDIVALWASHGRYYKPSSGAWLWQRPQLFQVTEDTHTMSYILPYVAPMIENAGGYVMLPRERNINRNEVIVDNDTNEEGQIFSQPFYREITGSQQWITGELDGFIYDLPDFRDTENPFENGTYRQTSTITSGKASMAAWYADIPENGEYAIYVSYKSLPNSTEDALYTVNYSGGSKDFKVNQTMGGGTWIYLGTFPLEEGYSDEEPIVVLSNISNISGKVLTADAVKIGGGMGNISRSPKRADVYADPSTPSEETEPDEPLLPSSSAVFSTSGMPRYLEGARYWLHWAGFPEHVYSPYHGEDDYKDDYTSRGCWVNWLAGGSRVLPDKEGLNIPVDVAMALHSDAGKKADDSFIGTLGIYFTNNGDYYTDGTPRTNSRSLTDLLLRQITTDIRQTWEPNWTRRAMWDKSYVEARVPEVPTSLIEFMSHQNFADMRYALDPAFRFSVSRSIYKAIGRFIAERKDRKFVVQPLPVKDFAIRREKKGAYKLSWAPTHDPLEDTAEPHKYIIEERSGTDLGFHKLTETNSTSVSVKVSDNEIHSFRVIAANDGGVSFPSEILSLREGEKKADPILIINGFTRISAPISFATVNEAGFNSYEDFGVPYLNDISFIGYQKEFNRNAGETFGNSGGEYAAYVIAGNTFDYPYIHGLSISANGYGFVSASMGALEAGDVNLSDYKIVDVILGKQKLTQTGTGYSGWHFPTFSEKAQKKFEDFSKKGGDLFVSGAYVASDLFNDNAAVGSKNFAYNILGISPSEGQHSLSGSVTTEMTANAPSFSRRDIGYSNTLNEKTYIVENPDVLSQSGLSDSSIIMRFSDTGLPAGIASKRGNARTIVMSIPFESIDGTVRNLLMGEIIDFLNK